MASRAALAAALVVGLALTACSGAAEPTPTPTTSSPSPSPSPEETTAVTRTCTAEADGYAVDYPADWHVNDPAEAEPCRWFHPEPFTLPQQQEATGIAIPVGFAPQPLDELLEALRDGSDEVVGEEEREAGERRAVRVELRSGGQALLPDGTRITQWLIDFDSRTMTASTHDVATAGTYDDNVAVLDAMMRSLRRVETAQACSARDMPPELEPQGELPGPVAETRRAIHKAAVECDYEALAQLITEERFTYSFGETGNPVAFWQRTERDNPDHAPMRYLAGLLARPHNSREVDGRIQYEWPSAFTYDSWPEVPEEDREALKPLYDEQDFADFERFGGYIGYRVVITQEGAWTAFVAGD